MQTHDGMKLGNQLPAELRNNIWLVEENDEPVLLQAPVLAHVDLLEKVVDQQVED